jgi:hypothetical protein
MWLPTEALRPIAVVAQAAISGWHHVCTASAVILEVAMRKMVGASAAVLALAGVVAAAGCGSSSSSPAPAAPTPVVTSTATVTGLKIVGPPNSFIVVGDTAQFTATATFSNGTTADVTNAATWSTLDPSIFAVAPGGKVTAMKVGSTDVRATYQGATDKDYTTAQPFLTFKAYGTVTAAPPDFGGLAGARVDISPSPSPGFFVTTNGVGDFEFPPLKGGPYTLTVTRAGFTPQTRAITLTRDIRADFPLLPTPPAGATARCKDKSWSYAATRASACVANAGVSYFVCPGPLCS